MEYGFHMSTRGATEAPDAITQVAQHCEAMGYGIFGVNDHVVVSRQIDSKYPYSQDGSWAGAAQGTCLETLTTLGFLAASTEKMRLLTSVLVLPHRRPVLTAKMLSTIDVLSKGRLTVGVGVGWMEEELAALEAPPYKRRGAASHEYMAAFRTLWSGGSEYHGEFVDFQGLVFAPTGVQPNGPPLWVGGEGPAARQRAARFGDGWYPVGRNPQFPLDSVERFSTALADVRNRAEVAGRDPSAIDVAMFAPWCRLGQPINEDGRRLPFTGSADDIKEDVASFENAGLKTLVLNLEGAVLEETLDRTESFAKALGIA
ncbi:MAG: putative F420-dependent oxidoreductase [Gammaproteobacteria bacterium]|jgi:probable F420-dependent oxidoreductase